MSSKTKKPSCLLIIILVVGAVGGFAYFFFNWVWDTYGPRCETVVLSQQPSPTGRWIAISEETTCDLGFLAVTDITVSVGVALANEPARTVDLLGVDTGGHDEERPRATWSGSETLQVTVPNISILKILTKEALGMKVDLRFDPDDPAARARWRAEMGLKDDR